MGEHMSTNDQVVLRTVLETQKARFGATIRDDKLFEIFSAEQVVKDFDLSDDEIERGITGGGNDGGVDSIYAFVNGDLIAEDTDVSIYKKDITINLFLTQSKTSSSFSETAIDKFQAFAKDLLDLSSDLQALAQFYDATLIGTIESFRRVYLALAPRFPLLTISFIYTSQGDAVHPQVDRRAEQLRETVQLMFPQGVVTFQFLGAANLLGLARRQPTTSYDLILVENPTSAAKDGKVGYLCLVRLGDYFRFITTPSGNLNKSMFEANVRDYQGQTEVNEAIASTLSAEPVEDFWWLNNGVTVLASQGSIVGKTLTIRDPQIVNGLQTSTEIFNYRSRSGDNNDDRAILVRVIVSDDEGSRDRIIRATNSQTSIPAASLRATDMIHRNIEDRFESVGLYYDRRKNSQKNAGRARESIITIPYLAQAVAAIVLQQPDDSRARPSSLLKTNATYLSVFNGDYPIDIYLMCTQTMRRIDMFLRAEAQSVSEISRNDIQYHLAMVAIYRLLGCPTAKPAQLCALDRSLLTKELLQECYNDIVAEFRDLATKGAGTFDKIAKSPALTEQLKRLLGTTKPKRG